MKIATETDKLKETMDSTQPIPAERVDPSEIDAGNQLQAMTEFCRNQEAIVAAKRAQLEGKKRYFLGIFPIDNGDEAFLQQLQRKPLELEAMILEEVTRRKLEIYHEICNGRVNRLKLRNETEFAIAKSNSQRKIKEAEMHNEVLIRTCKLESTLALTKVQGTMGEQIIEANKKLQRAASDCRESAVVHSGYQEQRMMEVVKHFNSSFVNELAAEALAVEAATSSAIIKDTTDFVTVLQSAQTQMVNQATKTIRDCADEQKSWFKDAIQADEKDGAKG